VNQIEPTAFFYEAVASKIFAMDCEVDVEFRRARRKRRASESVAHAGIGKDSGGSSAMEPSIGKAEQKHSSTQFLAEGGVDVPRRESGNAARFWKVSRAHLAAMPNTPARWCVTALASR